MITEGEAGDRRERDEAGGMQTNYGLPADSTPQVTSP
jgi:hypothetical protein